MIYASFCNYLPNQDKIHRSIIICKVEEDTMEANQKEKQEHHNCAGVFAYQTPVQQLRPVPVAHILVFPTATLDIHQT